MEESGYRFGVGVLVLASAVIGVLLIAFFGAVPALWVDRYRVSFNFPRAPKVAVDTPVRKNGVLIGRVSDIKLLPGNGGVILTLELDRKFELQKAEVPRVGSGSFITGDAVVEFVPPSEASLLIRFDGSLGTPRDGELDARERAVTNEIVSDSYYSIGGEVAADPQESLAKLETTIVPVLSSLERTMTRIDGLAASVQSLVGDGTGPIKDLVSSGIATFDNATVTLNTINRVAAQVERADIPGAVANAIAILPELFGEAQTTLAQTQRTLKGFEQFSASLEGLGKEFEGIGETVRKAVDNANVAIANIAEITEPVKQNSERLVKNAVRAFDDLDVLSQELKTFSNRLNNSNGTIAQLIDNPQLYYSVLNAVNDLRKSSNNIQVLTQKLQPIVGDIRVLSDKAARNPGVFLRGAFRPAGVGIK